MESVLSICLFANFSLKLDRTLLHSLNSSRLQALLAYLLLKSQEPQPRSRLAFLLWPDSSDQQARTNLRNLVHLLRQSLPDPDRYLDCRSQTIQWRNDSPYTLDVQQFEEAFNRAVALKKQDQASAYQASLEEAIHLYRGDLLPDCYSDWILPERERLHQAYLQALNQLITCLESQQDYRSAITYTQRLLQDDPLQETAHRLLIRLHILNGDRAGAKRAYLACEDLLLRELGVEPSPATREVYELLVLRDLQPAQPIHTPESVLHSSPLHLSMVGRESEWKNLMEAWNVASSGRAHFILVRADPGIGKSRLLEELYSWASTQKIRKAFARAHTPISATSLTLLFSWLDQLPISTHDPIWQNESNLLNPSFSTAPQSPLSVHTLSNPWQRRRFFLAMSSALLALRVSPKGRRTQVPLLLLLDDLQWCDTETLDFVRFLLTEFPHAPILVVAALDPGEVPSSPNLRVFLDSLRQLNSPSGFENSQFIALDLKPLSQGQVAAFLSIHHKGGDLPDDGLQLWMQSEGVPGNLVYLLSQLTDPSNSTSGRADIPNVEQILSRFNALSSPAQHVAGLAAASGGHFLYQVIGQAANMDEEALNLALDELNQRRFIVENETIAEDIAFEFIFHYFGEAIYAALSAARRRYYHRRLAIALSSWAENTALTNSLAAMIAFHSGQAGLEVNSPPKRF
jgi:DNA-binding SARP family transcriptional activator